MNLDLGFSSSKVSIPSFSFGNALNFGGNGSGNVVNLLNVIDLSDYTVNVWLNMNIMTGPFHGLFGNTITGSSYILHYPNNNRISVSAPHGGVVSFYNVNLPIATSTMLTIKRDFNQLSIYVDGIWLESKAVSTRTLSINRLGGYGSVLTNYLYDGVMNEAAIWDTPLSDIEISGLYNSGFGSDSSVIQASNFQLYLEMEGSGSDVLVPDSSSNNNNGSFLGQTGNHWVAY